MAAKRLFSKAQSRLLLGTCQPKAQTRSTEWSRPKEVCGLLHLFQHAALTPKAGLK